MPKTGLRQLWQLPSIGGVRRSAPPIGGGVVSGAGSAVLPSLGAAGVGSAGNPGTISGSGIVLLPRIAASGGNAAIIPGLIIEYVDETGADRRVAVNNNGTTTISGVAPLLVTLKAYGTRAQHSSGNTFEGNFFNNGHGVHWGEGRGGSWPYSGATSPINSRDVDFGPPLFGHAYEIVGTHQLRYRCRDALGNESTVVVSVNVLPPPTVTIIEPTAGGWPTPVSGTHYGIRAGQSYNSFGTWNFRRVHNVLVSKVGAGADPTTGEILLGGEMTGDLTVARERTRHVRFLNIDIARITHGHYGALHSGAVNGRVRRVDQWNSRADYQNNNTNPTQRAQIMWPRGFYLYNTGIMNEGAVPGYLTTVETHLRMFHAQGVRFHHPANAPNQHLLRFTNHENTYRNCQVFSDYGPFTSYIKHQAQGTYQWQPNEELIGDLVGAGTDWRRYANSYVVWESCFFGGPGEVPPGGTNMGLAPQNGVAGEPAELHEFCTIENCSGTRALGSVVRGGRWLGARGLRNPDNSPWLVSEIDWYPDRIPAGAFGPYVTETNNSRPIPSAF